MREDGGDDDDEDGEEEEEEERRSEPLLSWIAIWGRASTWRETGGRGEREGR